MISSDKLYRDSANRKITDCKENFNISIFANEVWSLLSVELRAQFLCKSRLFGAP